MNTSILAEERQDRFEEIQWGPWSGLLAGIGLVQVVVALRVLMPQWTTVILLLSAGIMLLLAFSFASLTVIDTGSSLLLHFGPIALFSTEIRYEEMQTVEWEKSKLWHGWGIHYVRGGWLWNIRGFDCIKVVTELKTIRIGTQRPEELLNFLLSKSEISTLRSNF